MKLVLEKATLHVGIAPGIRVLAITDPSLPAGIEIEVVLSSFNAAEAARHLVEGSDVEQETRGLKQVEIARA